MQQWSDFFVRTKRSNNLQKSFVSAEEKELLAKHNIIDLIYYYSLSKINSSVVRW